MPNGQAADDVAPSEPMHLDRRPRAVLGRAHFARSRNDRVIAGVAGGLARRLQANSYAVRLSFVLLALAGGVGVVVYALAWLLSDPERDDEPTPTARPERSLAVFLFTAAGLVALRAVGLWPGDGLMLPAVVVAGGTALVWHDQRSAGGRRGSDPIERLLTGRVSVVRVAGGLVLTAAGLVALAAEGDLRSVPRSAAALGLALAGVAVAIGPYAGHLLADVRSAERERIRAEERAEMAAQLHDSVLQTLALMQRAAPEPRRMVLLARRQERELRHWLYDGRVAPARTLAEHAEALTADIEFDHDLPVELVVVGDHPVDEAAAALLGAVREATVNAAKHAGAEEVAVYIEVGDDSLVAFVRDKGRGFDPAAVPSDRHGIESSIRARLQRVGGCARLETAPGAGTEWELEVPG